MERNAAYAARSRNGAIVPSHLEPRTSRTKSRATKTSPRLTGNVIKAIPSVILRTYRRMAAWSACTAEKTAGVTCPTSAATLSTRSEEHTSELQSHHDLVCRLLLEKKK